MAETKSTYSAPESTEPARRSRANIRVINDSKPAKYFYQVPNIIDDMGLSVFAYRLYLRLVRISSLRNALSSTRALAKDCKMSTGSVSNAKAELVQNGLISIAKKPSGRGEDFDEIHILDITLRNVTHCETLRLSSSGELSENHSSPHELISSSGERISSPHERISSSGEQVGITKENLSITEGISTESGASAPPASALASAHPSPRVITLQAPESPATQPGATGGEQSGTQSGERGTKRGGKKSPANFTEHADTRVQLYLTYILPEITETNAERIMQRVSAEYADEWEAAIAEMATGKGRGTSYKPTDFVLLFDLYDGRVRAKKAAALMAKHAKTPANIGAGAAKPAAVSPILALMNGRIARP